MHPFGVMCVARADMDMYQSDPSPTEHLLACPLAPSGSACAEESSLGQRRTLPSSTQPVLLEAACERLTTPPPRAEHSSTLLVLQGSREAGPGCAEAAALGRGFSGNSSILSAWSGSFQQRALANGIRG